MGDSGVEPDGGGSPGGTGRRRRSGKQDRALYQPGKGFGGSGIGPDQRGRNSPAPSTGSNQGERGDPMDAVQQKLHEMSMRGPPASVMKRYGNSGGGNGGRDRNANNNVNSMSRGGRGQGELWHPDKGDSGINNNRSGGNNRTGQTSDSSRWKSDRRASPSDRWSSGGNDNRPETPRGSSRDLTGSAGGHDAGRRGRSAERPRRDSNCSQMSAASSADQTSTNNNSGNNNSTNNNNRGSTNWRRSAMASGEVSEQQRQQQGQSQQDKRMTERNNESNPPRGDDDGSGGGGRDEVLQWQRQGVIPPRGNVSGRQLWVDESGSKNENKPTSWRSGGLQGDGGTARQGEKAGAGGNEATGSEGGKGRKKERRERRKRGPLERRRVDDGPDDDTPEAEDPSESCPLAVDDAASGGEAAGGANEEGAIQGNEARQDPDSPSHEDTQSEAANVEANTQKPEEQSDGLVALYDATASVDPTGEKALKFIDPEDDEDKELSTLSLTLDQAPVGRIDWTECPTPPPLEELQSRYEDIQPVPAMMGYGFGDRRAASPPSRSMMRGHQSAGSDGWGSGGGRRRLDSDASSCWSQYSGRSNSQSQHGAGSRRDRRMNERSGGGRFDRGGRRGESPGRRSPDHRQRGMDWDREYGDGRCSQVSGEQKRYGGFQAESLPPRFQRQREEQLRLQQQQLDRQMLIEQMQKQQREEKEARERQRKEKEDARERQWSEQAQLRQRRDQQPMAARERRKPVEVENWRRRDNVPERERPGASTNAVITDRQNNNSGGHMGKKDLNTNWRSSQSSTQHLRDAQKEIWTRNSAPLGDRRGPAGIASKDEKQKDRRGDAKELKLGFDRDAEKGNSSHANSGGRLSTKHGKDLKDFAEQRDVGGQRNAKETDQRLRDVKNACSNNNNNNKPLMSVRPVPQVREDMPNAGSTQRPDERPRQLKGAVEKNLAEGTELEKELSAVLADAVRVPGGVERLGELRAKIQLRYEHVILYDPRYSTERNVEQMLWKSVYHQVIEALRREADPGGPRSSTDIRGELCAIVEEGLTFYESLLERMQELHGFRLDQSVYSSPVDGNATDSGGPRSGKHGPSSGTLKILLISAQKMLISLGDLCRYREQALESANFARARDFYLRAQQLAPKNGKPYNQLALLAVYSRRKLDAVYYYMRSLAASNPFLSAKESLTTLFDEVRKSCESIDRQRRIQRGLHDTNRNSKAHMALPELARCEIWIRPDGSSWQRRGDSELEQKLEMLEEINALSDYDLTKRFTLSFLHVHGKLFSKIGMEHFGETAAQMLLELRTLVRRPLAPGAGARFLQLLAICMFSVANNSLKNTATLASNARSLMQELSVQVAMSLVAHIMERCTERVEEHLRCRSSEETVPQEKLSTTAVDEKRHPMDEQVESPLLPADVEELLPVLKVWTDWMSGTKMLWCPPPNPCEFATHTKCGDVWSSLAELLTALIRADSAHTGQMAPEFATRRTPMLSMQVSLPEDLALAGFVPLIGSPLERFFAAPVPTSQLGALRTALRISRLHFFGDYLCGLAPSPYFHFDVRRSAYGSLLPETGGEGNQTEELIAGTDDIGLDDEDDEPAYESQTGSDDPSDDETAAAFEADDQLSSAGTATGGGEMEKLRRKKHLLQKRVKRHNRVQAYIERVLHSSRVGTTILEIRPRFLIPDTNCLVDHLDKVRALVACKTFSIYIPIIVVNELDGLARGCMTGARTHQSPAHAARVTAFAREALGFLESRFARREPKLRTVTSRGNLIDSISFRTEAGNDLAGVTNDDLILSCAVSLGKSPASGGGVGGEISAAAPLVGPGQASGTGHSLQPGETEAPLRLFREAVLLTEDRNLAVKAMAHNVPVRDITSFVRWAQLPLVDEGI